MNNHRETGPSILSRISFCGLAMAATLVPPTALAQGYSTDIELVRPVYSHKGLPGIDTPLFAAQPTMRVGMTMQYERDPVILYQYHKEIGAVVKHRNAMALGVSYDFTPAVGARLILPFAIHGGSDIPELEADGLGMEDMSIGARFRALQLGGFSLGARADFTAPIGSKDSFHGEDGLRTGAGLLASFEAGPVTVLFDTNVMTRTKLELAEDWENGTQLAVNTGVRYWVLPDRIAVWVSEISRGQFTNFYKKGSAENTVEMLGGVQYQPVNYMTFHLGGGAGLAHGTGGTAQRILLAAKFVPIPPPRPDFVVEAEEEISSGPPPDVSIEEILTVEKKWKDGELARVEEEAIVIRDPIQFEFNTANILPESLPTLHFVAKLMNQNARIGHVVVEGHASEEGEFLYNYDLSIRRARSIWEEIITAGVHPARLSYRGMGEVAPKKKGTEESDLAKNRRVDFHIIHRYNELDVLPEYPENIQLPWSGRNAKVKTPEDIERKMQEDKMHRRRQRDLEGLEREEVQETTPVVVPASEIEEAAIERMEESDDDAAPEDPSEDPVETDDNPTEKAEPAEPPAAPAPVEEASDESVQTEGDSTGKVEEAQPATEPAPADESNSTESSQTPEE